MTAISNIAPLPNEQQLAPYRAICRTAVVSAVMAAISLPLVVLALVSIWLRFGDAVPMGMLGAFFAGIAFLLGFVAARTIRRYPTEYTGARLANFGLFGGMVLLVAGSASAAFTYSTEVPEGYSRVGFWELQPDPDEPQLPISPKAFEFTGKP